MTSSVTIDRWGRLSSHARVHVAGCVRNQPTWRYPPYGSRPLSGEADLGSKPHVVVQPVTQAEPLPGLKRELGLRDLTVFAIVCVTSARWIPIAAHAGTGSLSLWLLAVVFFVVPLTIAVAALVAKYPGAGGLYLWTRNDFGPWNGFLCFWSYWIGIAFLFPTAALLYTKVGFSLLGNTHAHLG